MSEDRVDQKVAPDHFFARGYQRVDFWLHRLGARLGFLREELDQVVELASAKHRGELRGFLDEIGGCGVKLTRLCRRSSPRIEMTIADQTLFDLAKFCPGGFPLNTR